VRGINNTIEPAFDQLLALQNKESIILAEKLKADKERAMRETLE
jgi:hypothetical protein